MDLAAICVTGLACLSDSLSSAILKFSLICTIISVGNAYAGTDYPSRIRKQRILEDCIFSATIVRISHFDFVVCAMEHQDK